jgi:cellulose synthase/poly-beta-1,6-N-acetylglucosamine synthase-like glycosyltransferase
MLCANSHPGKISPSRSQHMLNKPDLSVIVVGRNEGERLVRCLESVLAARPHASSWEIIYVDSQSNDGSVDRAARLGARVISVAPVHPCAAVGRNAGWAAARADTILFLDGDTFLALDFVKEALGEFNDPRVGVVFGNRRESNPEGSIYNRVLDLDWIVPSGSIEFCGGEALVRRELLEAVGGYDEGLMAAEDTELCARIRATGYTILHLDRPMVLHDLAITRFSQYWRRAVRTGYAYAQVSERIRPADSPLWYRQARRNRIQGSAMLGIVAGAPILGVATRSFVLFLILIVILAALPIRTAIRSRWKNVPMTTRLLHGLHSHLMQIPLLFGQVKYQLDRFVGADPELIEYKDASLQASPKVKSAQ